MTKCVYKGLMFEETCYRLKNQIGNLLTNDFKEAKNECYKLYN